MPEDLLITGAAGRLGSVLRRGLADRVARLHLTDRKAVRGEAPSEVITRGDLADWAAADVIVRGVDAVVHVAGIPDEAPFDDLVQANIRATYHVFEAARHNRIPRVILASSAHVSGFYPRTQTLDTDAPPRPDTLYAATKVFDEALARLYHDKHGIEVACLRIGSFREQPRTVRQLSTWLSPADAVGIVARCLDAQPLGFQILYAVSANHRRFWTVAAHERMNFRAVDNAEKFATAVAGEHGPDGIDDGARRLQGGVFTTTGYHGGHG
jgi:uronate dehydrogenase